MTTTLVELKELLATRFDEVTLLELLEIDSYKLVEAFADVIEERYEYLITEIEDLN